MANILSLVWYKVLPAKFGGQKGIAGFSQYLARYHRLIMMCAVNNEATGQESYQVLNQLPTSKRQFTDSRVKTMISSAIDQHHITHLILEHCYHGWHGVRLAKKKSIKLIVHSHNIEYDRFREMGKWWWPFLFLLERWTHRSADLSLFKTLEDQEQAIQHFGIKEDRCMVVPFGIERTAIPGGAEKNQSRLLLEKKHGIKPETRIILFNGTLDYEPNALALQHIVRDVIPALEQKTGEPFIVLVTGRIEYKAYSYLKQLMHPRYLYAGSVDDIEAYFNGADIFINPVIHGGGVKVKLMEALSYGLPVVSYYSGARGIDTSLTGHNLTVMGDGDVEEFAAAVVSHWNHADPLPAAFFSKYSWHSITGEVAKRIEQL